MAWIGSNIGKAKSSGTWKTWAGIWGKSGGAWKRASSVHVKSGGNWIKIFDGKPLIQYNGYQSSNPTGNVLEVTLNAFDVYPYGFTTTVTGVLTSNSGFPSPLDLVITPSSVSSSVDTFSSCSADKIYIVFPATYTLTLTATNSEGTYTVTDTIVY